MATLMHEIRWPVGGCLKTMTRRLSSASVMRAFAVVAARSTIVAAIFISTQAFAQRVAPSQVTPPSLRPEAAPGVAVVLPGAAGLTAPANAAGLSLILSGGSGEGGFPELRGESDAIFGRLSGRRVTVADIYAAANALEQAYAAAGYVLVRIVVPPQRLARGATLRLVLVDGFVEAVDVKGVPESQRELVMAHMSGIVGKRHVTFAELERRLLLVSDVPGLTLRSTLSRGATPGGTLLVLEGTQNFVSGSAGVDNRLPNSLGIFELNSSAALNSAFGYGEQIYVSGSSGYNLGKAFDGASPLQVLGGGFVLPVGVDGFTLNPEYTNSITRPIPAAGAPASVGYFERFDLRAAYPVIRTRAQTLTLQATYEWAEEHLTPTGFDTDFYRDRYHAIRMQADDRLQTSWGAATQATATFSQGLGGRDEQTAAATGIGLSRQGAQPTFSKLNLDLRWTQPLPEASQFTLIGRAQTGFGQPLFLAEQFSLDGLDALSGYPSGTFNVDEGATLRGELARPFALATPGVETAVSPYLFGAGGRGILEDPTAIEQAAINAASFGLGLRTGASAMGAPFGGSFAVELARSFSNVPGERQNYRGDVAFAVKF